MAETKSVFGSLEEICKNLEKFSADVIEINDKADKFMNKKQREKIWSIPKEEVINGWPKNYFYKTPVEWQWAVDLVTTEGYHYLRLIGGGNTHFGRSVKWMNVYNLIDGIWIVRLSEEELGMIMGGITDDRLVAYLIHIKDDWISLNS